MKGIGAQGVIPVVKHFPGHGDTSVDSHKGLPIDTQDLNRIRQGAGAVMVGHLLMTKLDPDTPASMSPAVIQYILRGELGFDGVVITDDMTMEAIGKTMAIGPAAVKAALAGADIILVGSGPEKMRTVLDALAAAVQDGQIPQSDIDASVSRIIKLKLNSRLSDQPTEAADVDVLNQHIKEAIWLKYG